MTGDSLPTATALRRYRTDTQALPRAAGADFFFLCLRPRPDGYHCLSADRVASVVKSALKDIGAPLEFDLMQSAVRA